MRDEFDRSGDRKLRDQAKMAVAEALSVSSVEEIHGAFQRLLDKAKNGVLTDSELEALDTATDLYERLEAFDRLWVFAQRYLRHKFVSTDPLCDACGNAVPHRTLLQCPTCGEMGPWTLRERRVPSSFVHYYLAKQIELLVDASLILPGGKAYADGMTTAMARGGAKSTWLCEATGLWLILTGRSRCLLITSNTTEQVTERCNEIRLELEENEKIIADFGEQAAKRTEGRVWTKDEFILPNGARVVGKGAMQSMRGVKNRHYRPDVVISDDSDDDKFVTTPEMANKLLLWWDQRVVPACHPNAVFMVHGTVIGEMALLWQLLNGHRGGSFRKQVFPAILDRAGCQQCGMPADKIGPFECPVCGVRTTAVNPCSYWGGRFTVAALRAIESKIGVWAFQTEFMQRPHDDSTSWFKKDWLDKAKRTDLAPISRPARRIIPGSIMEVSLTGEEAAKMAAMVDPVFDRYPSDMGPYQVIVQSWDPAWARETGKNQLTAYMAGIGMGLTWDDRFDIFWIDRDKGLPGNDAYREWMYRTWLADIMPINESDRPAQLAMIIERNSAGVLFQYGVEETWSSVPLVDHQTGAEKHDLEDGIPGMASDFAKDRFIIRAGGSDAHKAHAEELIYELKSSGSSLHKDLLMATWFAWSYIKRWMRDIRDPARYIELTRRRATLGRARTSKN